MIECSIDGVIIKEIVRNDDDRGWLMELYRRDELDGDNFPVMSYMSMTRPGIVRGPHEHKHQSDLFAFVGPSMFRLYLWDNRDGSSTYGNKFEADFGEYNKALVIVPPGVVHAYKNIGTVDGLVINAPNQLYGGHGRGEEVDEIRHEDNEDSPFKID